MKKLTLERTIDAPIEKVWEAWTDPDVTKLWWSPPGMHCAHYTANVKEGGRFLYCFKMNEDDQKFWGRGEYQRFDPPKYLSYTDSFTDEQGNDVPPSHYGMPGDEVVETLVEVFFTEEDGKTHMKLSGDNPFPEKMTKEMTEGWNGMFDKLEALVTE